jgi:peptide/nickel transport system substrate-binding protein
MFSRSTSPRLHLARNWQTGAIAVVAVAMLGGCAPAAEPPDDFPFAIGIPAGDFVAGSIFDPIAGASLFYTPSHAFYEALVSWDAESQSWGPWLAKEFTLSPDGKTAEFAVRDDVDFTDGSHLDADAVKRSLDGGEGWGLLGFLWDDLNPQITVIDEYSLEITTDFPIRPQHLSYLSAIPIVSSQGLDTPEAFAEGPVGTGPYVLEELVTEDRMTFVRNDDYWNPDAYPFDELTFISFADKVAALNALQSGQIDATQVEASQAATAEAAGFRLSVGVAAYNAIFITDHEGESVPALGDARVRQAMSMAFDRETIIRELEQGYGKASSQPFLDGALESVPGGDDRYPYDPERAKELLAEAGYPDGFTLPLNSGSGYSATDYGPVIESSLAAIGITVEWRTFADGAAVSTAVTSGELPAWQSTGVYANTIDPYIQFFFLREEFADPKWTELYTNYQEADTAGFEKAAPELAEYILEQALYVTISHPAVIWATIEGIEVTGPSPLIPALRDFEVVD